MSTENSINIKNRQASYEYAFIDKYLAGIQLTGTEIKSIREGKANISDAFCVFLRDELFIRNMNVSPYFNGTYNNVPEKRDRKLLLNRQELNKLQGKLKDQERTIFIKDLAGRLIYENKSTSSNADHIDLSALADGMYFVSVLGDDNKNILSQRVVKQ